MLGNGHHLDGIVASLLYARQHLALELLVGRDALLLGGHTYVCLVDEQILLVDNQLIVGPIEGLWNPKLRRVVLCLVVLHKTCGIGRYAVVPAILAVNVELIE